MKDIKISKAMKVIQDLEYYSESGYVCYVDMREILQALAEENREEKE